MQFFVEDLLDLRRLSDGNFTLNETMFNLHLTCGKI